MATMLTLAFWPIGDFAIAKSAYGNVTGAIEIVGIGLDLYNGTNNTDGIYQTYTIFVDTSEMMCGLLMKKTTVLRYQWFKHNHAASWTLELISADEYYTRR